MRFLRPLLGTSLKDKIRSNIDIRKQLESERMVEKIHENLSKWHNHIERMPSWTSAMASIFLSPYWKKRHWTSKNETGTTIPLVLERVMTQSLNWQKKKKNKLALRELKRLKTQAPYVPRTLSYCHQIRFISRHPFPKAPNLSVTIKNSMSHKRVQVLVPSCWSRNKTNEVSRCFVWRRLSVILYTRKQLHVTEYLTALVAHVSWGFQGPKY
jgi:hypothetical protein